MNIKINNKKFSAVHGQTILDVALEHDIKIPSLCYHPDLDVRASCRVCVVEIKGYHKLVTACSTKVEEGMEILTDSQRVKKSRNLNIELIFASHIEKCATCTLRFNCDLLKLAQEYGIKITRFPDRKAKRQTYKFANAVEIDGSQCIDCGNCVEACHNQGIDFLHISGHGHEQEIQPVKTKDSACIYCGQCTNACPVAAAQEQGEWQQVEAALKNKKKIVVAQFAPSIRVSLGEEFGLPYGYNCAKKINTALKMLGFSYIFDINFGADITTMTEAEELMARINDKQAVFPMTTSCCPAWVAYAEFYHPELLPNLTTARSPQIHGAGAIKSYFAKQQKINSKKIEVVSIVPCTSKKYEAARKELSYKGSQLVNYVLTTRELAYILKKNKIDLASLPDSEPEPMFNDGSGAAAIYGASGGVMESALRTVVSLACAQKKTRNKLCASRLEFKQVRGLKGFKEATVDLAGKKVRVGVVNGIAHFEALLPKLHKYHYIEVMACPGGCLGGGGQPLPTTNVIRQKRLEGMYAIDKGKTKMRRAHENKPMLEYYQWVKDNKLESKLLHTKFKATNK
ncbi:MAG TPA: [FeFe] hydrogenase, group A [Candidatus Saccharimonadales bacterium]|nr:[FeFe] hydrogenase, group A [Candidatus Saccharimonadales bacterium]